MKSFCVYTAGQMSSCSRTIVVSLCELNQWSSSGKMDNIPNSHKNKISIQYIVPSFLAVTRTHSLDKPQGSLGRPFIPLQQPRGVHEQSSPVLPAQLTQRSTFRRRVKLVSAFGPSTDNKRHNFSCIWWAMVGVDDNSLQVDSRRKGRQQHSAVPHPSNELCELSHDVLSWRWYQQWGIIIINVIIITNPGEPRKIR